MKRLLSIALVLLACSVAYAGPQTASTTTGTNLIAQARVYLDESSQVEWSETQLLRFLNDGMVDIVAKTHCYQTIESISLVANTIEYTPVTNYISIVAVVLAPATGARVGLVKGNISSQGRAISDTTPAYWYEFGGKLGVYPAYSAVTTETVKVYEVKYPAAIAASGNVATPAIFDKALVYYITAQAFLQDKRINEANNYLNLYQSELDRYRKDFMEVDNETTEPIR